MELSPTAKAILGILAMGPGSGYDIKGIVDDSTRYFWAASYGQIYPELKRLEERGLVAGSEAPTGGRSRKTYELTAEGREVLSSWLAEPPEIFETRNEGMLKLFVAESSGAGAVAPQLEELRRHAEEITERLHAVEEKLGARGTSTPICLQLGIELNEWIAGWCERAAGAVDDDDAGKAGARGGADVQRTR